MSQPYLVVKMCPACGGEELFSVKKGKTLLFSCMACMRLFTYDQLNTRRDGDEEKKRI